MSHASFLVQRNDLRKTLIADDAAAGMPLGDGQARLRIDLFALTANNVTYGAFGDAMHYWDFFPCDVAGHGRIPVWGFAEVVESRSPGVAAGQRYYGYYPMSSHVVLQPGDVNAGGFVDTAAHRQGLHPLYNKYLSCASDALYRPEHEAQIALLRPLFVTSFLIDDFLADNGFFGAGTVLFSSASSKTAYGTAFCLAARRGTPGAPRVVGLTSRGNADFTSGLGCYDAVVAYEDLEGLPADTAAVYVDISGSATLRSRVHARWRERLAYSCSVGGTHWDALGSGKGLDGPRPVLFFAPAQAKERTEDWGGAELGRRLAAAWGRFMVPVTDPRSPWLTVASGRGPGDVEQVYRALIEGRSDPREGHVLAL
jgi:hypothetical protein